jgi:hypothetical protein
MLALSKDTQLDELLARDTAQVNARVPTTYLPWHKECLSQKQVCDLKRMLLATIVTADGIFCTSGPSISLSIIMFVAMHA